MASLLQTRKTVPHVGPVIVDAFIEGENNEAPAEQMLVWPGFLAPWPRKNEITDYDESWFVILGNLPVYDNGRLCGLLGRYGYLGLEWPAPLRGKAYWTKQSDVGNNDTMRVGIPVSRIWIEIATYQETFRTLYEPEINPVDEFERARQILIVRSHLNEQCQIGFDPSDDTVWSIQPNGALGAAWIQLAEHVVSHKDFKTCECPGCNNLFATNRSRGKPRKYCGDPCKAKAGRLRRASA